MFKWVFRDRNLFFYLEDFSTEKVPFLEWTKYNAQYLSQLSIIQELIDNGKATVKEYGVEIDVEEILSLEDIDKKLLGLPSDYPFMIYIESDGVMSKESFRFKYGFFDFIPNGNKLFFERDIAILQNNDNTFLLSLNQYKILDALDTFNSQMYSERTFHHNLTCFADIKSLADDVAIMLDSFLKSQSVLQPEKIKIDVSFNGESLELNPQIDSLKEESFTKAFDLSPSIKSIYNVANQSGGTTRVILDDQQKRELVKVKRLRRISALDEIKEIAENPENYFSDDIIDLGYFSQRVREVGIYKPKFYPFVCPYKSEWIPGFIIKDKLNGEKRVHFKSQIELADFQSHRDNAIIDGNEEFTYMDEQISVKDADKIILTALKQFENSKRPKLKDLVSSHEEVLIIKENAEILEYSENNIKPYSLEHTFSKIQNLSPQMQLKTHQIEGVAWLQSMYNQDLSGCLLADDMGLGKTLQILYFIEWHAQNSNNDKPYLIVAPVSILENWENEYKRYFEPTSLDLLVLYGKTWLNREFSINDISKLQKKQLILTNYETLKAYQLNLGAVNYAVAVLDEAQKIKTPGTLVTNISKALKSDFRIAMTGTPVENTLVDLWCIMDFSVPGLLGNAKDFAKNYQKPLIDKEANVELLGEKLRDQIGLFIKRRLKEDVAQDLPKKLVKVIPKAMPEVQANRYADEIELLKNKELLASENRGNQMLKFLWAIRDISDHPYLQDRQINFYPTAELIESSAKLQILIEVLEEIRMKEEKVIIFADRKETQKMLQKVIHETFNTSPPSIINGDTPSSRKKEIRGKITRQQTIDRFQRASGFNVIIMSQLAAGVGLNVVGANHVVHYSRHWNPAKEEQATDRAYRIGQTRDVTVYFPMAIFPETFISENGEKQRSFDQVLDELLKRKKELASKTLFPTEQTEVRPDELFKDIIENAIPPGFTAPLSFVEIEKLNPRLFEAFVGTLYSNQGFKVSLTPYTNDKGADIVAFGPKVNYLIQVKQSQSIVGNSAIQEVVTSRNYYEKHFSENFQLVVLTNNYFGPSARTLSENNNVDLIDGGKLEQLVKNHPITVLDIYRQESQRLEQI